MLKIKDVDLPDRIEEIVQTKINTVLSEGMVPYYLVLNTRAYLAICTATHRMELSMNDFLTVHFNPDIVEYKGLPIVLILYAVEDVRVIRRPFEEIVCPLEKKNDTII